MLRIAALLALVVYPLSAATVIRCGQLVDVHKGVLIPNATHFVLFEKPRHQFFEEILGFIKE